jgi:sterol desaturase/sphingolipid hydroxylase (fatty acid hydroxylase superfamily)
MDTLATLAADFSAHVRSVFLQPFDADSRLFYLYIATSLLVAWVLWHRAGAAGRGTVSFLRFLFPASVWRHPSAWLDVRYFFFHSFLGNFALLGVSFAATLFVFQLLTGFDGLDDIRNATVLDGWQGVALAIGFMVVSFVVSDFTAFFLHFLQHKIPLLWQFHKVHHSAEVMHPLSNFREHPIDELAYYVGVGATYGLVIALAVLTIGYVPDIPLILGVPIFAFLFNVAGYSLRHSHIWLRWPGKWSMVFPSPAHHQVHHSSHPDHLDKNFAFFFPIWDVLFGCYVMPEDNRDVKFGVTEKDRGHELNSCVNLYVLPFRDAWRVLTRKPRGSKDAAPPDASAASALTPTALE